MFGLVGRDFMRVTVLLRDKRQQGAGRPLLAGCFCSGLQVTFLTSCVILQAL